MTKALLIIDVQNAILSGKAAPARQPQIDAALNETVARLRILKERAAAAGVPVVLIQHDGDAEHRLAVGTAGWVIRDEIAPAEGDVVIHKKSCDSFFETDLAERLEERSATHLVIGGCMSEFCRYHGAAGRFARIQCDADCRRPHHRGLGSAHVSGDRCASQ